MWIDRAFVLRGSGTVVAGTLLSGSVKIGDRVELLPAGIAARVKRIQVHKQDVSGAGIGQRVALNLPGVEKDQVNRGDLLASPDHYRPTFMINARFLLLSSVSKPLENRTRIRLHLGSSEHIGRMVLLEPQPLIPGGSALVQFRLEDQAMADTGDRFVVRSFSEGRVIGGGVALEIHPRKMKEANPEELERLRRRETAEPTELVRQYLAARGERSAEAAEIAQELAFPVEEVVEILGALRRDGEAVILQGEPKWMAADRARFEELKQAVSAYIAEFHAKQPHLKGARRSDLKSRLMPDAAPLFLDRLIGELAEAGVISAEGELIRLMSHQISFSIDQEALKERITAAFAGRRFQPPEPAELASELKVSPDKVEPIVAGLVELGVLLKLHDPDGKPLYYHRDAIEAARAILLEFFKSHTEMRFFEFRELIGSTRKFTTPILTHFDDIGITYRTGEVRKTRFINE